MIRTSLFSLGLATLLGVSMLACAGEDDAKAGGVDPEVVSPRRTPKDGKDPGTGATQAESQPGQTEEPAPAKQCVAKTCAQLGQTCGKHDDGCFGQADCGECAPGCTPKTCAQLGKSCGQHDDGCGKTADCGACAPVCAPGTNKAQATALMLGEFSDSPATNKSLTDLKLPDGDEDWYKMTIKDAGFSTNPRISASVIRPLEVTIFFVCNSATNYSTCPNTKDVADATVGKGCKGTSNTMLQTDCTGFDEAGTAYVRVRKLASDGLCAGYGLDVVVD